MAELLQLRGVSYHAGPRTLFDGVDLLLHRGDRLGLVGPNGAGKSTLLRILAGEETPATGERTSPKHVRAAWARQELDLDPTRTVAQVLTGRMEHAPGPPPDLAPEIAIRRMLGRAGFSDPAATVASLSGGWKRRLAIASELVVGPDLLLLDEPTNHLDVDGIEWLERTLLAERASCVIVSHDRRFLETVCTRMAEIDRRHSGSFFVCDGAYSDFLERREDAIAQLKQREASLNSQLREEIRYLRQGPKARTSKNATRVARAYENIDELARVKSLNREQEMEGAFSETGRRTKRLLVTEKLGVGYEEKECVRELDLILGPGRRVGLVGPNGSGKTTLLRTLLREHPLRSGTLQEAPQLRVVYFDQEREQLDEEATLAKMLSPEGDMVTVGNRQMHVVTWAKQLLFRKEQLDQPVKSLSGGERARVLVARLMRSPADVLLLDEPTNDLDISTIEQLERSLLDFEGAVVLVTHDRFLMDRVCTDLLALDGRGGWRQLADLAQWQAMREESAASPQPKISAKPKAESTNPSSNVAKLSYNDKRELEQMEERILEAEERVEQLVARTQDASIAADPQALSEAYAQLHEAQGEVDRLYARWSELGERAG